MNRDSIIVEAKKIIADQLGVKPESIENNATLKSLGLDSFRVIELVLFIERRTSLNFPDHSYTPANLRSIETIADCFISLQK